MIEVELPVGVQVRETYLEVRTAGEGQVVTVVELLSPANERAGTGRRIHLDERQLVLSTHTSSVELDLLRGGEPMPTLGSRASSDYSIPVSRGHRRPKADLMPFGVREPIPPPCRFGPARASRRSSWEGSCTALYARASYDLRIDYGRELVPPLSPEDADWAKGLIRERGAV